MFKKLILKTRLTNIRIIVLGFLVIILFGALLLSLPFASRDGHWTAFIDSLFTSVSATCVTGLSVFDTFTHWSLFGQIVIMLLIQVGGIGFMTVIALMALFTKKQIRLRERTLLMQSAGSLTVGGVVDLLRKIVTGTFCFELLGAIALSIRFVPQMGAKGIYFALFHSVSAFCNAGFDLMGQNAPYSSLTAYAADPLVNLTLIILIVTGGLGFIVWSDLLRHKWHFGKYRLHTKIVLVTTAALLVGGTVLYYLLERNGAYSGMSFGERLLASMFQSVTPRTAGMSTVDPAALSEGSNVVTSVLMLIGGNPGSTAGGIKTTTVAVLLITAANAARGNRDVTVFKRRIGDTVIRQASAVLTIYTTVAIVSSVMICAIEPVTLKQAVFEVCSAVGTVGLTLGITPALSAVSKIIIMLLMFGGRIGAYTLALALSEKRVDAPVKRPSEKLLIG